MPDEIIIENFTSAITEPEKPEIDIVEVKQWKDANSGKVISEEISAADGKSFYRAQIGLQTQAGTMPIPIEFPEDLTLEQCFENFEDIANACVEELQNEARNQIVEAPAGIDPSILK